MSKRIKEYLAIAMCISGIILWIIPFIKGFFEPELTQTQLFMKHWEIAILGLVLISLSIPFVEKDEKYN